MSKKIKKSRETSIIQIRDQLKEIQPNFKKMKKKYGKTAFASLKRFLKNRDEDLSCKAVWLASEIGGNEAEELLELSSKHRSEKVRTATANCITKFSSQKTQEVLDKLLMDKDVIVVLEILKNYQRIKKKSIRDKVKKILKKHPNPIIMKYAKSI